MALRPITEVFRLHDVKRASVDADIKLTIRTRLTDIARDLSHIDVAEDWPRSSDINILCEMAASSFICASTAMKFMTLPYRNPGERKSHRGGVFWDYITLHFPLEACWLVRSSGAVGRCFL